MDRSEGHNFYVLLVNNVVQKMRHCVVGSDNTISLYKLNNYFIFICFKPVIKFIKFCWFYKLFLFFKKKYFYYVKGLKHKEIVIEIHAIQIYPCLKNGFTNSCPNFLAKSVSWDDTQGYIFYILPSSFYSCWPCPYYWIFTV